jgi:hypothetical protein
MTSTCHLARQACQWLPSPAPEDARVRDALLRWLQAFLPSAMTFIREDDDNLPELLEG